MPFYTVRQGDCLSSIGQRRGFTWKRLWEDPNNAELREERGDPNVLRPGDRVFIPEKKAGEEACSTADRHRFVKKEAPAVLRLKILRVPQDEQAIDESLATPEPSAHVSLEVPGEPAGREDEPDAGAPYSLDVDGRLTEGETDADGMLEVRIEPTARRARLTLHPGAPEERILVLDLGHVDPVSTLRGVKHRLHNLGFGIGAIDDSEDAELAHATGLFQQLHGLSACGRVDDETRRKLEEVHGS